MSLSNITNADFAQQAKDINAYSIYAPTIDAGAFTANYATIGDLTMTTKATLSTTFTALNGASAPITGKAGTIIADRGATVFNSAQVYSWTFTNANILADSIVLVSAGSAGNTTANNQCGQTVQAVRAVVAGSFTLDIANISGVAFAGSSLRYTYIIL